MTKTLLAAALAMTSLATLATAAQAAALPKQYIGTYCGGELVQSTEPCNAEDGSLTVTAKGAFGMDDVSCRFLSIRLGPAYAPATRTPRSQWVPSATVRARCEDGVTTYEFYVGHGFVRMEQH